MPRQNAMNEISSKHFSYHAKTREMTTFASDLPNRGRFERIYPDACDVGLRIRSEKTGRSVTFAVYRQEIRDGDLCYWELRPIGPNAPNVKMRIWND